MHYAIQSSQHQFEYLTLGSRKPTLKHQLFHVTEGVLLIRLGKMEYAVNKGQWFWLPANCLSAISHFPNSACQSIEVSQRLDIDIPSNAGFITPSSLLSLLLEKLAQSTLATEQRSALLTCIRYELCALKPNLQLSALSKQLNQWQTPGGTSLSVEMQMVMRIKESEKLRLSGRKEHQIATQLFEGKVESYLQARQAIMGI